MDIITIGKVNRDLTVKLNPENQNFIDDVLFSFGGSATNTAVALSRLGLRSGIVGCVGELETVRPFLDSEGIDFSNITKTDKQMGLVLIKLVNDEKEMHSYGGANLSLERKHLKKEYLNSAKIVHLSGTNPDVCREAIKQHKFVTLDPGYNFSTNELKDVTDIIKNLKFFFPTEAELLRLCNTSDVEESIKTVMECGLETLLVKRVDVITIVTKEKRIDVPIVKGNIVDISGCGDAFAAGFLYGHINRMDDKEACEFGIICAKLKSENLGASSSPKLEDVKKEFNRFY